MSRRLTELLGRTVHDERGVRVGRLLDLVVSLEEPHPRVQRVCVGRRLGGRLDYPAEAVRDYERIVVSRRDASGPALADDELFLDQHVLDAQIVDLGGRRVTRVGDVALREEDGGLSVNAVLVGAEPILRRLRLRRLAARFEPGSVDWEDLHLASRRGHELQLRSPVAAVHRAGAGELGHLVTRVPRHFAHEILSAVGPARARSALAARVRRPHRFPFSWMRRRASR